MRQETLPILMMNHLTKISYVLMLLQVVTQNVESEEVSNSIATEEVLNSTTDNNETSDVNGRRSGGIIILGNPGNPDGHITSHKVETATYTTRVTSGSGGSGVQGWVSGAQSGGNIVQQPQLQGIVQSQEACGQKNNVVTDVGGQSSTVHKHWRVDNSQTFNADGSIKTLAPNGNQWQSGKTGLRTGSLVLEQPNGQTLLNRPSQVTSNNLNDASGSIITSNTGNQQINTIQQTDNIQKLENFYRPDLNSYKVSLVSSGDGIYAKEPTGQQNQNLNVIVSSDSNSANIMAVPVMKPQLGQYVVQGYRPNIQHYLNEIETSKILKNPSAALKTPSFIEHIKPGQMNINLSEDQLNSYKQYLIQSGLIKLKPYQLIFSDQFRPKLKTLQWMVVPLESNVEFCKQRCGALFPRSALFSSLVEHANKLPLKLLVPVLKIRGGLKKTLSGIQTVAGGVGDIPGAFQLKHSSSSGAGTNESTNQT